MGRLWGVAVAAVALALHPLGVGAEAVAPHVEARPELCDGLAQLDLDDVLLCTHGADHAPATLADGAGSPVPRKSVTCLGDGRSGQRVQVLYVHGSNHGPASSALRSDIRSWAEQVEWTVWASARGHGGDRRVRWQTSACAVQVTSQVVSSAALLDFGTMVKELRSRGYKRSDRSYLAFVHSGAYCGIATAPRDDSRTSNRADRTPGYARVDRGCWDTGDKGYHSIAAHELMHTLGAVQRSAPNATSGAHCTDEHDLLCYDDGTGGSVRIVCKDNDSSTYGSGDRYDRLLDCRGDDYFNPSPRSGSYLTRHWNTADSARLHDPTQRASQSSPRPSPTGDPVGYALWLIGW